MTQDQQGQTRGVGYVVRGEVVPDDEAEMSGAEQTSPTTRFQKVASALGWHGPDQADTVSGPGHGDAADDPAPAEQVSGPGHGDAADDPAPADEVGAGRSPDAGNGDDPDDEAVAATGPGTRATDASSGSPVPVAQPDEMADQPGRDAQDPSVTRRGDGSQAGIVTELLPVTGDGPAVTRAGTDPDPAPGDLADLAYGSLVGDATELRAQWHEIQFMFVDDPRGSVSEAADVIAQVSAKLEAAIQERLRAIQERQRSLRDRWGESANADTETLRETLRMYRKFLDHLTGSRAS